MSFSERKNNLGFVSAVAVILIVFLIGAVAVFYFLKSNDSIKSQVRLPGLSKMIDKAPPTPTPFPFQEMAIPFLRQREFSSTLGNLEKLSENANYTSFITSYNSDGLKVYGLLTIPKNQASDKKFPAIIFIHGYIPPSEYRTAQNYLSYVDYLAKNGFVVFKIDLRGHDKSEGEAGGGYYSADYIIDTLNAYSALQSSNVINPAAIGLWGHSMAGNVVLRSFVANQNIPAIVIWAGAVYSYQDFSQYRISDGSYRAPPANTERARKRKELFDTYGQFHPDSDFWKQVAPTNYLDGLTGAVQVHHALDDNVVSIDYSRNLMKLFDKTTIPHELFEYPNGGHNLTGNSFSVAMNRTVEFFREKLGE